MCLIVMKKIKNHKISLIVLKQNAVDFFRSVFDQIGPEYFLTLFLRFTIIFSTLLLSLFLKMWIGVGVGDMTNILSYFTSWYQ